MKKIMTVILIVCLSQVAYSAERVIDNTIMEDFVREVVDQTIDIAKQTVEKNTGIDLSKGGSEKEKREEKNENSFSKDVSGKVQRELNQLDEEHDRKIVKLEEELNRKLSKEREKFSRKAGEKKKSKKNGKKRRKLEEKINKAYSKFDEKIDEENKRYEKKRNKILEKKK